MEDDAPTPIIVRDFNLYAVRSACARTSASGHSRQGCDYSKELPNGNQTMLDVKVSMLDVGSVFKGDVQSSLPYVEVVTWAQYQYDGVLAAATAVSPIKQSSGEG